MRPSVAGRVPRDKARLNAENLFVACIASAHMQSFLQLAFAMGVEVLSYRDEAHVVLTEAGDDYWISEHRDVGFGVYAQEFARANDTVDHRKRYTEHSMVTP